MVEGCSEESVEIAIAGCGLTVDVLELLREAQSAVVFWVNDTEELKFMT